MNGEISESEHVTTVIKKGNGNCNLCFTNYDQEQRKRVRLDCSHGVCYPCFLSVSHQNQMTVVCPLCWQLSCITLNTSDVIPAITENVIKNNDKWCLACGKLATAECHIQCKSTIIRIDDKATLCDAKKLQENLDNFIKISKSIAAKKRELSLIFNSSLKALQLFEQNIHEMLHKNNVQLRKNELIINRARIVNPEESVGSLLAKVTRANIESEKILGIVNQDVLKFQTILTTMKNVF